MASVTKSRLECRFEQQQLLRPVTQDQVTLAVFIIANPAVSMRPLVNLTDLSNINVAPLNMADLINTASQNRYDLKEFADQLKQEEQNIALQRALAVPNLTVQATYKRNGSYILNYFGIGVSIGVPVLNKNKSNIQPTTIRAQASQQALAKARQADRLFRKFDSRFNEGFGQLIQRVVLNYQMRNIDVVEFIDFFDSYKSVQLQYSQLQNDRMQSIEELNFATGTTLFEEYSPISSLTGRTTRHLSQNHNKL
jgi:cobalt-zinc-cadmium efflux system outer membrane protein